MHAVAHLTPVQRSCAQRRIISRDLLQPALVSASMQIKVAILTALCIDSSIADLGFHAVPAIVLILDLLFLSPPWTFTALPAIGVSSTITIGYYVWVEFCFSRNGWYVFFDYNKPYFKQLSPLSRSSCPDSDHSFDAGIHTHFSTSLIYPAASRSSASAPFSCLPIPWS